MFTKPLDALLVFMITTPVVGWIAYKKAYRRIQGVYAVLGLSISACFLYEMYKDVAEKHVILISQPPFYPPPGACLEIDMLSVFMAIVSTMLGLFAAIYSIKYMEHDTGLTEYYTLLLGMVAGMMGVAFAGDFFTMFVFWELMCLTSYALVAFRKRRWEPIEAGFKYLIMSAAGSATILLAMSFLYGMTGTVNFACLAAGLSNVASNGWLYVALALTVVGFGVKAAIVPLHTWLPDAHPAAPTPISAMLSGAVIASGVYALCRVLFFVFPPTQFHWGTAIAIISAVTMTVGNLMALLQGDVKRLLAYSSIAQIGYTLVGVATGTQLGLTGTTFHIFNHALMKGLAFLCAGAFVYRARTRDLDELAGIGRRMPVSTTTLCIALFALAGIPPLNGFMSKLVLFTAAIQAEMVWLAVIGVLNSAFSAAYYLRLAMVLFRSEPAEKAAVGKEVPIAMLAPMCVMSAFIVLIGVWPEPILDLAQRAAACLIDVETYISAVG